MTAVIEANGPGQALRPQVGPRGLHARDPGGPGRRAGRSERGRQDDVAATWPSGCWRPTAGTIEVLGDEPASSPDAARPGRLRGPGHADLLRAVRGRPSPARRLAQPALGRRTWPSADRAARPRPEPAGRQALRRPAGPAGAHPGGRQAARAADPGRAGGEPGPARPARVPADPDGDRGRAGGERRALLAPGGRPRAGLRLPDRARLPPGCRSPARSRSCWRRTTGSSVPAATPTRCPATKRSSRRATPSAQSTLLVRDRRADPRPGLDGRKRSAWRTWCWPTWARRRRRRAADRPSLELHSMIWLSLAPVPRAGRGGRSACWPWWPSSLAVTGPHLVHLYDATVKPCRADRRLRYDDQPRSSPRPARSKVL